jgi:hypothetical protein
MCRIASFGANSPVVTHFAINLPFTLTGSNTLIISLFLIGLYLLFPILKDKKKINASQPFW